MNSDFSDFFQFLDFFPTFRLLDSTALKRMFSPKKGGNKECPDLCNWWVVE